MKEFGMYRLKQSYFDEFIDIDPNLADVGTGRPMICIKSGNQSWLLPLTSLDPDKFNYTKKCARIVAQLKQEVQEPIKAMATLPDFLHNPSNQRYQNIVYFSMALPVKKKYAIKWCSDGQQIFLPAKNRSYIRQAALKYVKEVWNGRYAGFMKAQAEKGFDVSPFQRRIRELKKAVYSKHFEQLKRQKLRKEKAAAIAAERAEKQAIKDRIAQLPDVKSAEKYLIGKGYPPEAAAKNAALLYVIAAKKRAGKDLIIEHKKEKEQNTLAKSNSVQKQK